MTNITARPDASCPFRLILAQASHTDLLAMRGAIERHASALPLDALTRLSLADRWKLYQAMQSPDKRTALKLAVSAELAERRGGIATD